MAAAVGDIEQARWYEKRRPGVGVTFITRVDEAIQSIAANPQVYQQIHRDVRARGCAASLMVCTTG